MIFFTFFQFVHGTAGPVRPDSLVIKKERHRELLAVSFLSLTGCVR